MYRQMKLTRDRRGSTLIEVIVSVLIVGIAFVPLMIGLNAAMNVNKENEKNLYAENVAQNVIEVCKTYGANGLAAMAAPTSTEHISDIFNSATTLSITSAEGTPATEFTITDIESGTGKMFEAVISFDSSAYDPDPGATPPEDGSPLPERQNDFSNYPSLSSVTNASMISIGENSLDNIVEHFYNIAHDTFDTDVEIGDMKANVSTWLKRKIKITIDQPGVGEPDEGRYIVKKQVIFSARDCEINSKALFKEPGYNEDSYAWEIYSDPEDIKIGSYGSLPQNIILTYKPMKNSSGIPQRLYDESIVIDKEVNGSTNLYSLCENGSALIGWEVTCYVEGQDLTTDPDAEGNIYRVKAFSNLNLLPVACKKLNTFGEGLSGKQSKMKDVTVTVSDGTTSVTKTSTVIEFE